MAPEITKEIQLEIAHVLFIDIVGYSKLSVKDQHAAVEQLNQIVRASEQFQRADSAGRLLKVATGDDSGPWKHKFIRRSWKAAFYLPFLGYKKYWPSLFS